MEPLEPAGAITQLTKQIRLLAEEIRCLRIRVEVQRDEFRQFRDDQVSSSLEILKEPLHLGRWQMYQL